MVCWLALLLAPIAAVAADAADRIGVPGPIRFGDTEFALQWVSNPSPELYKQEYVPAGQRVERYDSMLMIDVRPLGADLAQTARAMIEQIEARKATDPVANFEGLVNEAGDEVLLFVNSMGATPLFDLYIFFRKPFKLLAEKAFR